MKFRFFAIFVALVLGASPTLAQSSIGIYGDPSGSPCAIPVTPGGTGTAYIIYAPAPGVQTHAVEYAMLGWPGWIAIANPNPGASFLSGDPLGPFGCNMVFQTCQGGSPIVLFTVSFFVPPSPPTDIHLQVVGAPGQTCPRGFLCDAPTYTPFCVLGDQTWLNPSGWQPPELLSPADGATQQPVTGVVLQWNWSVPPGVSCTPTAFDPIVYFGTEPNPPLVGPANQTPYTHATGPLSANTTYYWRIFINGGGVTSPVWHFTTETVVGSEPATWQQVKRLFR